MAKLDGGAAAKIQGPAAGIETGCDVWYGLHLRQSSCSGQKRL